MSLGIRTIWRARAISPASSLVSRASVASPSISQRLSPINNLTSPACTPVFPSRDFASDVAANSVESTTPVENGDPPTRSRPSAATASLDQTRFSERLALIPVRPHDADSILVRSRMEYPNPKETRLNDHLRHRDMKAQSWHEDLARANHHPVPNWRKVLEQLTARTPRYLNGVVRVLIPEPTNNSLLNPDADNSLWDIRSRTRCHMVLEQERDANGNTVLKISGARRAVEQAIDDIVQVAKNNMVLLVSDAGETVLHDGTKAGAEPQPTTESRPEIRIGHTRSLDKDLRPGVLTTSASGVSKPARWTKQTLEQYVAILARGHLPVWRANALYPGRRAAHQKAVLEQLVDVFYDPETQSALSGAAFKIAFDYIARRGRTARPQARVLFDRMEKVGVPTDTTIFNLLMEATVHDKDLRSFSTCLFLMGRQGHEPNFKTWLLFLRIVQSEEVRRYILQAMIHKNLLVSPENRVRAAYEMASFDAERAMLQGLDVDAILDEQSKLYGPEWLDFKLATPICNKIIEVLAKHSKWDQVDRLIDFMASRPSPHVYPDEATCNVCLERARVQTHARSAVDLLQRFESDLGVRTAMGSVRSLFLAFWHQNMAHCMDVMWQFAVLTGRTSSDMGTRVSDVLHLAGKMGWDKAPVPTEESDALPATKKHAKQYGFYALLMASSKDAFGVADAQGRSRLPDVLRRRGLEMRSEGRIVPRGALSNALREAAERDLRFHKGITRGKWIVEPALLATELYHDKDGGTTADFEGEIGAFDDGEEVPDEEDEILPEQVEDDRNIVI
ncbi:hypothetical protein GE09DRAFT_132452 [Coniochaeta sp. 2T2.1]|nr:hypothetical protein GE09DRAFT_132452 [Coniochaeta sp. 2T2.1]